MTGHTDPLAPLLADGVIDEVVARLKSGKEADLWIVRHAGEAIAAKVYKARHVRSFKNDAGYREGRQVRDTRTQRAMDRGSRFGKAAAEEAWKTKEADALHALHAAGVRVPRPVNFYEGVLLMELVLDAHGHPAPRLVDARVGREHAAAMYADLRGQAVRMLCADLIHGDLSPYNVLVGAHGPVVIDFPQVVGAAHNSQAEAYFRRDLENLRRFFAHLDPALNAAAGDAREIWRAYERRELAPDFVPTGREPPQREPRRGDERRGEHPRAGHGRGAPPQRGAPHQRGQPRPAPHRGGGHPQAAHAQGGRSHGAHPPAAHPQGGRPQGGHPQGAHPPGGRAQGGHARGEPGRGRPPAEGGRRERGREPDRRRPPAPEVVRVVRPPLAPANDAGKKPGEPHRGGGPGAQRPPASGGPPHRGRRWRR